MRLLLYTACIGIIFYNAPLIAQGGTQSQSQPNDLVSLIEHQIYSKRWDSIPISYIVQKLTTQTGKGSFIKWCNGIRGQLPRIRAQQNTAYVISSILNQMANVFRTRDDLRKEFAYYYRQMTSFENEINDVLFDYITDYTRKELVILLGHLNAVGIQLNDPVATQIHDRYRSLIEPSQQPEPINLARGMQLIHKLDIPVQNTLFRTWLNATRAIMLQLRAREASTIIQAAATTYEKTQRHPGQNWIAKWLEATKTILPQSDAYNLSQMLSAIARLYNYDAYSRHVPRLYKEHEAWFTAWFDRMYELMQAYDVTPLSLTTSIFALAQLQLQPSQQWFTLWIDSIINTPPQEPRQMANITFAIGALGVIPHSNQHTQQLCDIIKNQVSQMNAQDLETALYGACLWHAVNENNHIWQLANTLADQVSTDVPSNDEGRISQLRWSLLYLDKQQQHATLPPDLSIRSQKESPLESKIFTIMEVLSDDEKLPAWEKEQYIPEMYSSIDAAFPEHNIALEVDGPTHFYHNTQERVASDHMKDKLLHALGWNVRRISHMEWDKLTSDAKKREFILNTVNM